jgi:hypothetical protein
LVLEAIERLDHWVREHDYQAYDPFDGLSSAFRPAAIGYRSRQALVQLVLRSPVNLRPILGIRPATSSKAMGYFARAYLNLYRATGRSEWIQRAQFCLDWLREHPSPNQPGISWGNHFDYQTRGYYLPKGGPTVVWTSLIGHAFLDAFECLGRQEDLAVAVRAAQFVVLGLERRPAGAGTCISYVPGAFVAIHNSNMLAAGLLSRVYFHTREESLREIASGAVAYTAGAQLPNGAWWYGEEPKFRWVDNWHTAYVLDSLWWYLRCTRDEFVRPSFDRGVAYWVSNFFLPDGTPKYYPDQTYPIDIQCASQAIESLCLYARDGDSRYLDLARNVTTWAIANLQDSDGHFIFRRGRWFVNHTPMLHWGQATMLNALASVVASRAEH